MELRPYEHYDYVILLCKERTVFANLCDKLKLEKQHQMGRPKKIGLGRAINGQIILDMLAGVTEDTPMVVIDSAIGIDDEELSRSKEKQLIHQ